MNFNAKHSSLPRSPVHHSHVDDISVFRERIFFINSKYDTRNPFRNFPTTCFVITRKASGVNVIYAEKCCRSRNEWRADASFSRRATLPILGNSGSGLSPTWKGNFIEFSLTKVEKKFCTKHIEYWYRWRRFTLTIFKLLNIFWSSFAEVSRSATWESYNW